MSHFDRMIRSGLPVDWKTVLIGIRGIGNYFELVSMEDVISYAAAKVADNLEAPTPLLDLASAYPHEKEEILSYLSRLAEEDPVDSLCAIRKWRLVLLQELLDSIDHEPVHDLISLSEFWLSFDNPSDSPHVIQGVGNHISPLEYYTLENLHETIRLHQEWMQNEREALQHNCYQ